MSPPLRIAVYGPESTGKTDLAAKLATHFRALLVAEYARERWDAQGGLTLEDMLPIAKEQWRREDAAVAYCPDLEASPPPASPLSNLLGYSSGLPDEGIKQESNPIGYLRSGPTGEMRRKLVICDTEALTTMLWSDLLYGATPEELRRGAEQRCRNYALYLLLDIDVPFAPDPQRCFPNPADREQAMRIWRGALDRRNLPYVLIRGDWAARERAAIAAVERVLRG